MDSGRPSNRLGLVLSAGGARAAYQVGVLKYLAHHLPEFDPKILTGISAGSINAAFLAQGDPVRRSTSALYDLWAQLTFGQVFETNFTSLFKMGTRWLYDLFLSKMTQRLLMRSILDASPLSRTLLTHTNFWKISRAIRAGHLLGLAISANNYYDGTTSVFYDSTEPLPDWHRERRRTVRCALRIRHLMASCSIPLLFEPVPIGGQMFGDGSLRFSFPFSPALHLRSSHILAIGIRAPLTQNAAQTVHPAHLSLGFVAGAVLNSIFLDSLEFDYENLVRINNLVGPNSKNYVPAYLVRPSRDLGVIAADYLSEVPFHFRQLLRATASAADLGDLLSYLMFSPGYIRALLELGEKDAASQHQALAEFLKSNTKPLTK